MKVGLILLLLIQSLALMAQSPNPPCGDDYGSAQDEANIIQQMRFGTISDAQNAIDQAKNTRGTSLGCPQIAYNHNPANYNQPSLNDVSTIWNTVHLPAIESFTINCPRIGRYENNAALGAYYANLAGFSVDLNVLYDVAQMQMAQQYTAANVSNLDPQHEGVFGYVHTPSSDPCYPGGVVGSSVAAVCANIPSYCVTYDNGLFAGEDFLIGDQYDPLSFYDGGIAYDHGWVGAHLIEAGIQQVDANRKSIIRNSLLNATDWAKNQEVVKNHNYTAKLIWLLAQMYNWTGDSTYRIELDYKLNKNLLPSVLMDLDNNGFVDGTNPNIAFQDLTTVAEMPGRNWDGHNSLPWYNAMNAWAITDAYVAFRDRGETLRAQELKPYVIAMLDNLSWEINNLGIIDDQLGVRDLTFALLNGIWKVAQYENEAHPEWESAAWAMWNSGYFNTYSTHSVCVGLYLCVLSSTPYQPLFERESFVSVTELDDAAIRIYPNPSSGVITVKNELGGECHIAIKSLTGQEVYTGRLSSTDVIDLSTFGSGIYLIAVMNENGSLVEKVVIQ
ncbi:MAG: T9SS type A sorting domain-containing protein [bacterium]|nr:T9SS type A sorting domain-containing protein [bacterium]